RDLALGENDAKVKALGTLGATGGPEALELLRALEKGEIQTVGDQQVLRIKDGKAVDLLTGQAVTPIPESRDDIVLPNRVRREMAGAIAALELTAPDRATRLSAATTLQKSGADEEMLPVIQRAIAKEQDPDGKALLTLIQATIQLSSGDKPTRLNAIRALAESRDPGTKTLLLPLLEKKGNEFAEPDSDVRAEAELSLRSI